MAGTKEEINEFKQARIDLIDEIDKVLIFDDIGIIGLIKFMS